MSLVHFIISILQKIVYFQLTFENVQYSVLSYEGCQAVNSNLTSPQQKIVNT